MTAASSSYSTTTDSMASLAAYSDSASTTATASPTKHALSTATGRCSGFFMSSVTGQAHGIGPAHSSRKSAPENAATTPGWASAWLTSTERIRACAYGL